MEPFRLCLALFSFAAGGAGVAVGPFCLWAAWVVAVPRGLVAAWVGAIIPVVLCSGLHRRRRVEVKPKNLQEVQWVARAVGNPRTQ